MTLDTADDLEALEDRIGYLQHALAEAAEIIHSHHHHSWKKNGVRWIDLPLSECGSALCLRYSALATEPSERPTCDDDICDETCGSPHHRWNQGEPDAAACCEHHANIGNDGTPCGTGGPW